MPYDGDACPSCGWDSPAGESPMTAPVVIPGGQMASYAGRLKYTYSEPQRVWTEPPALRPWVDLDQAAAHRHVLGGGSLLVVGSRVVAAARGEIMMAGQGGDDELVY